MQTNPGKSLSQRRFDPFHAMIGFPAPIGRVMDAFLREPGMLDLPALGEQDSETLAIDISETDTDVLVRASLPGFTRDEISIEVDDGLMSISAQRSESSEETGGEGAEKWLRRERREHRFARSFTLPSAVNEELATAELRDGVLTLTVPKAERATRRTIEIGG